VKNSGVGLVGLDSVVTALKMYQVDNLDGRIAVC